LCSNILQFVEIIFFADITAFLFERKKKNPAGAFKSFKTSHVLAVLNITMGGA
jgi:hypothetical protein